MPRDHLFPDYRGRRVTVMGLGSFGGGVGAVRFLVERGALVTVSDQRPADQLGEAMAELQATPPQQWHLGRHDAADFIDTDLVVVNPAIRRDHPLLQQAAAAGVLLTSEMNLFWQHQRGQILAVTGSNGKSTTTALLHAMLQHTVSESLSPLCPGGRGAGGEGDAFELHDARCSDNLRLPVRRHDTDRMHSSTAVNSPSSGLRPPSPSRGEGKRLWLGGNIGRSLLHEVDRISPSDLVVLELSSFQLTDLDRLQASPHIAVITNFSPNHLDWHDSIDHYRWAKQTMLRWQKDTDFAVLNADDPDVSTWPTNSRRLFFGLSDHGEEGAFLRGEQAVWRFQGVEREFPLRTWLKLPGRHNLANALAAATAALAAGATVDDVRLGLESYEPLPHRLQFVGEVQGRRFYNDSLATTPESAIVGLQAFTEPVVLLAGGYDKQVDLSEMAGCIAQRVKAVSLMGQTAGILRGLIQHHLKRDASETPCHLPPATCNVPVISHPQPDFNTAFHWAWEHSTPGDVILLSPGCASYDWFRNFADRGAQFTEKVYQIANPNK